jgi:hypothetical protein
MTWMERHRKARRVQVTSFAAAGVMLLAVFAGAFLFREPGSTLVRQLLSGGGV